MDFTRCTACGTCVTACNRDALRIIGYKTNAPTVIAEALRDKTYYDKSGGGITFSGGEPTYQPAFLLALLQQAKANGLHTCLDTSGHVGTDVLTTMLPYADLILFDFKTTCPVLHKKYTGADNMLILSNLAMLAQANKEVILRSPIIPGVNDTQAHAQAMTALVSKYTNITKTETLPYHAMGRDKWAHIGGKYEFIN